MEGKLIKVKDGYVLMVENIMYATDNDKLSLKNCEAIANGYDLDDLADYHFSIVGNEGISSTHSFKVGFQKALELIGNKKFSEHHTRLMLVDMARFVSTKEMRDAWDFDIQKFHRDRDFFIDKQIQSLQKTEWLVEIDMEWNPISERCDECGNGGKYMETPCDHPNDCKHWSPKIGENRCLILKSVNV